MDEVIVVLTTWPDAEKARAASRLLVEERLAACANLVPGVESIYRWDGKVETAAELLVILKTTFSKFPLLQARVKTLHPYTVPEIVCFPITDGLPAYLQWVVESC